jgi:hypothetical protein
MRFKDQSPIRDQRLREQKWKCAQDHEIDPTATNSQRQSEFIITGTLP